jgi:signal transduction histidine kinase
LVQVQVGLRPLAILRRALNRVHTGEHDRIGGDFPSEVRPLVDDMNALLARERRSIERARQQAGDLAHGFKTPLAVMAAVARDLKRDGRLEAVKEIETQIDMMGRHVKAVLAHSRIAGAVAIGQKPVPIAPVVARVVGALRRIAVDRNLNWTTEVPAAAMFAGDENDLMEIVGNAADNAAKWATSKVLIEVQQSGGWLVIRCEDDGPGLPPGTETAFPARGRRLDESRDGTGLGLSIVAKIVEAYAGTIALGPSALGGLAVTVSIPMPGVAGPPSQSSSK